MGKDLRIVGLGGSLAPETTSLSALRVALDAAEQAGATTELFAIRELDLPLYGPDVGVPEAAVRLCDAVAQAQGMLWSSPLYHGSVSGSFKNAIDWLQPLGDRDPPYLTNKVVGLLATSGGVQGLQAVNTMEFIVRALRGWSVPMVVPVPRSWRTFDGGRVTDEGMERQLRALGAEVVRAARQLADTGRCDYDDRVPRRYRDLARD